MPTLNALMHVYTHAAYSLSLLGLVLVFYAVMSVISYGPFLSQYAHAY